MEMKIHLWTHWLMMLTFFMAIVDILVTSVPRFHTLAQLLVIRCSLSLRECAKRFQPANFIKLLHCTQEHLTAARKTVSHAASTE
jgi:hypothetical protein